MRPGDFTELAESYRRSRPGYPPAILDAMAEAAGARPGDAVADIGAGTGILSELLAARGFAVTAVEPNAAMRRNAPPLPGVRWVEGTFEQTGLGTASQRWATAAQAFHWADPPRALPELRRILLRGGAFSALWNDRETERSPALRAVEEIVRRELPDYPTEPRCADPAATLASTGHFGRPVRSEARHVVVMDRDRFLDLWRSRNVLNVAAGPERMERILADLAREFRDASRIEVPYVCRAFTAPAK